MRRVVIPYRFAALGLLVAAVAIAVVAAVVPHHSSAVDPDTDTVGYCPAGAPGACGAKLAGIWHVDASSLPTVTTPAGMTYTRGFVAKQAQPPTAYFTFDTTYPGNSRPSEISLRMAPAPAAALAVPKGATRRSLPGGRSYVDASGAQRSGPFVERVGGYEFVVSFDASTDPGRLLPAKLAVLAAVAPPA